MMIMMMMMMMIMMMTMMLSNLPDVDIPPPLLGLELLDAGDHVVVQTVSVRAPGIDRHCSSTPLFLVGATLMFFFVCFLVA